MDDFFLNHAISNPDPEKQFAAAAFLLVTRMRAESYAFAQLIASDPRIGEEIRTVSQLYIDTLCGYNIQLFRGSEDYSSLHRMVFDSFPASPGMPSDEFGQIGLPMSIRQIAAIAVIEILQTSPKFLISYAPIKNELRQLCLQNGFAEDSEQAKNLETKQLADNWETEIVFRKSEISFIKTCIGSTAERILMLAENAINALNDPKTRPVPQVEQKELETQSIVGLPPLVALDRLVSNLTQLLPPQMDSFLDRVRKEQLLDSRLGEWLEGKGSNPFPPLPENQKRDMMGTLGQISATLFKPDNCSAKPAQKAINR